MIDLTSDLEVLAATVDGEAEGETLVGKQAVAASIMNRVALAGSHPHFGDGTVWGACLAHMQYDVWMPGPDRDRIDRLDFNNPSPAFQDCINIAKAAMDVALRSMLWVSSKRNAFSPNACLNPITASYSLATALIAE
jgi:hypothetical protein